MQARKGDWMCTASGVEFWPLDPRPWEIKIEDIAHALSQVCRYGGHCREFYSVAQHSVLVARYVVDLRLKDGGTAARQALLHDAAEAYIGDMVRPLKRSMPEFRATEAVLQQAIAVKFDLPWEVDAAVKRADDVLLATEALALMPRASVERWTFLYAADEKIRIRPLPPKDAKKDFLWQYEQLFGETT